jgi:hypothetical protein
LLTRAAPFVYGEGLQPRRIVSYAETAGLCVTNFRAARRNRVR